MDDKARARAGLPRDTCATDTQWIVNFANYVWTAKQIPGVGEATVLDVGCGPGYGADHLAGTARRVVAVDLLDTVVTRARDVYKRPNLDFFVMRAERLGFAPGTFDAVVSHEALMYVAPDDECIAGLRRILRPGGIAIVSVPWNAEHREGSRRADYRREYSWASFRALLARHFAEVACHWRTLGGALSDSEGTLRDVRRHVPGGLRRLLPRRLRHLAASVLLRRRGLTPLDALSVEDVVYRAGVEPGLSMLAVCRAR